MNNVTRWARFYVEQGLNPLPSRWSHGRPVPALPAYAHYRDGEPIPRRWLDRWPAPNIQLCPGVAWGLVVIDVDGPEALRTWQDWHLRGRAWPETWTVRTRAGFHFWYRLPPEVRECPSRPVWVGDGAHSEIRILGDRSLVTAPPSRHVKPPHPAYSFLAGRGPRDCEKMTFSPPWIFRISEVKSFDTRSHPRINQKCRSAATALRRNFYPTLEAIPPLVKLDLARSWGLRTARGGTNRQGWIACRALDREDVHPSASFHPHSGMFWESGKRTVCFAGLAVALGVYPDLRSAFRGLGVGDRERSAQ